MFYGNCQLQACYTRGVPPSDDFTEGPGDLGARGWVVYDPGGNLITPLVDTDTFILDFDIDQGGTGAGAFWFDDDDGPAIYRLGTGSLRMTAAVSVQNAARTGLPPLGGPHFRICGLTAQDPASLASGLNFNYEHVGFGGTALGTPECEYKDTIDSVTGAVPGNSMPGFGSTTVVNPLIAQADRIEGELLLQRDYKAGLSDEWTMAFREIGGTTWTVVHNDVRPAGSLLPAKLAWGMMCYSSNTTHDISGTFSDIQFSAASPVT